MTKLGQVEITSPEPFRWGTGLDGTATWTSSDRAGVYNFTELTISDDAYIKVKGGSGVVKRNLIIFATKKITIGNNVVIDANPRATNTGRGATEWGSDTDIDSATINGNAPGIITGATWDNNVGWLGSMGSSQTRTNDQFISAISGGGGGGGGGSNSQSQNGGAGGSSAFKYTTGGGAHTGNSVLGYTAPAGGIGGYRGRNRFGDAGGNGTSVSSNTITTLKEKFTYTGKGYFGNQSTGAIEERDDFPVVNGGNGGYGGGSTSSFYRLAYGGLGGGQITLIAPEIIFPDAPENAENIAIPEGGYREGWYPSWNTGVTHRHFVGRSSGMAITKSGTLIGNPVLTESKGYGWQVGDEIEAPYAYAAARHAGRTAGRPPKFRVNAISNDGLGRVNELTNVDAGGDVFETSNRNRYTFTRNYPSSDLFLAATHDHDARIESTFGSVTSNAALLYAGGQGAQAQTDSYFGRVYPGIDANTASEDGIGGQLAGGHGNYQGLIGHRYDDGGSGSGGGGGGGAIIIIYNKFKGHPTIRSGGGEGPGSKSGGNRGGKGGVGGDGISLIGWKAMNSGPITWVKESSAGFKRGKKIQELQQGYPGAGHHSDNGLTTPRDEIYSGNQWPSLKNGEYLNDDGSST